MTLKIDIKDQKILSLLDNNSRLSNSQIAKKVRLSKPTVEYRINRLEKNKVIFQYYTIINFTKLGYSQYKIYFKFQNTNLETEQKIIDYWVQTNNSAWVAKIRGRWDLAVSLLAKSNFEFGRNLNDFMNRFSQYILGKEVLLTEYSPIYAREYLTDSKPSEFIYGTNNEEYELDKIDAIAEFEEKESLFDYKIISDHAQQFGRDIFEKKIIDFVSIKSEKFFGN